MNFKAIIFDMDYTLYDELLYFKSVFETFCDQNNLDCASRSIFALESSLEES